jgi:glutamate racemase
MNGHPTRPACIAALRVPAFVILCFSLSPVAGIADQQVASPQAADRLWQRDAITIVVTDSGLGGLSVAADLERGLRDARAFARVRILFVNALPDAQHTYNGMRTRQEQVEAFDRALEGMERWYKPDLILIACNTLSVVFPDTRFASARRVPVFGIVDLGVAAIGARLMTDPTATALILGTPTTIQSCAHAKGLFAQGISPQRVVTQACPSLETEIQADPAGDLVRSLIEAYAGEAREALGARAAGKVLVGLCCSHYGYSRALFQQLLGEQFAGRVEIVDPNVHMSAWVLSRCREGAFAMTETDVRVVSRAELTREERGSIATALKGTSPKTAAALRAYQQKMDLFNARPPAGPAGPSR